MQDRSRIVFYLFAVLITLLGFGWRTGYLLQSHPYIDEYYTMLAAEMVQQRGIPLLPSGLFYTHGFLYTYLIAFLAWLLKITGPAAGILQADMIYRLPNLLLGALSMALIFSAARQWFGSQAALVALALMAVYPHGIVWGARVRMYTMVYLLVPLVVYAVYRSVTHPNDKRWYLLTVLLFSLSLFVHNWMMILIPALVVAGSVLVWQRGITPTHIRQWVLGGVVIGLAAGLAAWLQSFGLAVTESTDRQGIILATLGRLNPEAGLVANAAFLNDFIWNNSFNLVVFGLTLLGVIGLAWLFYTRQQNVAWPMLYLYLLLITLLAEFLLLLKPELKQARYASPVLLPAFIILGGWVSIGLSRLWRQQLRNQPDLGIYILMPVVLVIFGSLSARQLPRLFFEDLPAVGYDRAFQFVEARLESEDSLLSPLPAAAYLYLDNPGYFVAQGANYNFVHPNTEGVLADRWVGAPWLKTAQEFQEVLQRSPRTWFVVDSFTLQSQFHSDWRQVVRYNMTNIREEDGVIVFAGQGLRRHIPTEPERLIGVTLANKLKLVGYSRTFSSGELRLFLFWQVLNELEANYTTFVHIRNQAGDTVAQADVQPLAGEYPTSRWRVGETVVDEIVVPLPTELPPGNYRLLVGLYQWDTMERLAVIQDTTGENAVELERIPVP